MKQLLLFSAFILCVDAFAQAPKGKAKIGTLYGQNFDENNSTINAADLAVILPEKDTLVLKIKTVVQNSCASEGCWLTFKINDTLEAVAKTKGHAFFVPLDIRGKTVVINGKTYLKTTSVKELKHLAEDAKKPKKEIDAITEPKRQVVVIASGIRVIQP